MGSMDDPIVRVLFGLLWLVAAAFGPVIAGPESISTAQEAAAYYAIGIVAVPVAVVVAYALGSLAIRGLRMMGVSA